MQSQSTTLRILFLRTDSSCRSQIAEVGADIEALPAALVVEEGEET